MKLLLDENVDDELRHWLGEHDVYHVQEMGWLTLANGKLLRAAEEAGFDALITADKNMRFQQNLKGRSISLFVLDVHPIRLAQLAGCIEGLRVVLASSEPGSVYVIEGPHPKRER